MTRRALWPLVSVLTAYLCCQLRRWAALLVIALFPAGGTVLQDATELIVTLPILLVLIRWIAPSVRALSRSPLLLQLQFGMIPLLSYLFDYFTRIYTDLLRQCRPTELCVWARYTRRGGLDINPCRRSPGLPAPVALAEVRQ